MAKKVVLAYSGGLDTSVLLAWIKETYQAEMIAFCANIGQQEELDGLEAKATKTGASSIFIEDLQAEFASDFIFPMIGEELGLRFTWLVVFGFILIILSGGLIAANAKAAFVLSVLPSTFWVVMPTPTAIAASADIPRHRHQRWPGQRHPCDRACARHSSRPKTRPESRAWQPRF
mgnify:CR=1 FL=1